MPAKYTIDPVADVRGGARVHASRVKRVHTEGWTDQGGFRCGRETFTIFAAIDRGARRRGSALIYYSRIVTRARGERFREKQASREDVATRRALMPPPSASQEFNSTPVMYRRHDRSHARIHTGRQRERERNFGCRDLSYAKTHRHQAGGRLEKSGGLGRGDRSPRDCGAPRPKEHAKLETF